MQGLSSNRIATYKYTVLPALLGFLATGAAYADTPTCSANDTSLECRMLPILHWLEAAAWILGILLVIVVAVAIHLFRKNRLSRKGGR